MELQTQQVQLTIWYLPGSLSQKKKKKTAYFISHEKSSSYADLLSNMQPKIRPADKRPWYEIATRAFYSAERPTVNGNLSSKLVYQQLLDRYRNYAKGNYLAVCTLIEGPSRIGKSFSIQ